MSVVMECFDSLGHIDLKNSGMLDHFRIVSLLFLDQLCSYLQRHFLYHYMPFPSCYDVNLDLSFGSFSYRSLYQISSPERQNSQNEFPLNTT